MKKFNKNLTLAEKQIEMPTRESHAREIYNQLCAYTNGNETVYEDVIIALVGESGLQLLREFHFIETCAIFNGRKLYAM